jgi:Ca2+-binding RTX toxin-like protein
MPQGGNGGGPAKGVNKILGNWKNNVLISTDGVDAISGRGGNDELSGLGGDDLLDGGDGDDVLDGGDGNDVLDGGTGNDVLSDYFGDNTLDGGAGDDTLSVNGNNNDVLAGGTGADLFSLVAQVPYADGTVATTTITDFAPGVDTILLPDYIDVLTVAEQVGPDVHIEFATGLTLVPRNTLKDDLSVTDFEFAEPNTIIGTTGDDTLVGTPAWDVIIGSFGNDTLSGGGGDDLLYGNQPDVLSTETEVLLGGGGNDTLFGGVGSDTMDGGDGDDVLLLGTLGNHLATGGTGADLFSVTEAIEFLPTDDGDPAPANLVTITDFAPGVDVIKIAADPFNPAAVAQQQDSNALIVYGEERGILLLDTAALGLDADDFAFEGPNAARGSSRGDTLVGNELDNFMEGLGGDDAISGLGGDDTIDGGIGNDTLFGGGGNDTLFGGDGDDLLIGRAGDDLMTGDDPMTGGGGADVFGIHIPHTAGPLINTLDGYGTDTITDFEIGVDTIRFGWT